MRHILTPEIEARTLALLTIKIMGNMPFSTVAFKQALPLAYECLQATKELLKEKQTIAEKLGEIYWNSEEGRKRREEAKARFEEFKKRRKR